MFLDLGWGRAGIRPPNGSWVFLGGKIVFIDGWLKGS